MMQVFVLAKSPHQAKTRLAPVMDADARAELAEAMLADMLETIAQSPFAKRLSVISSSAHLQSVTRAAGGNFVQETQPAGLNAAASLALENARRFLDLPALVLPADLPLFTGADLSSIASLWAKDTVVAASSIDGGTNALMLDPILNWRFAYGLQSLSAHNAEATRLGQSFCAFMRKSLACDLDDPAMLSRMRQPAYMAQCAPRTRRALSPSVQRVPVRSYA